LVIVDLFRGFASDRSGPVVFHCWGGKDRTGLVAALLLESLGVAREITLDDYELTSEFRSASHIPEVVDAFEAIGIGRDAATSMLSTPRAAMAGALDYLDSAFGGVDRYLRAAGLTTDDLVALRTRLLVES
jgi:protein-tyrosine phosphatase